MVSDSHETMQEGVDNSRKWGASRQLQETYAAARKNEQMHECEESSRHVRGLLILFHLPLLGRGSISCNSSIIVIIDSFCLGIGRINLTKGSMKLACQLRSQRTTAEITVDEALKGFIETRKNFANLCCLNQSSKCIVKTEDVRPNCMFIQPETTLFIKSGSRVVARSVVEVAANHFSYPDNVLFCGRQTCATDDIEADSILGDIELEFVMVVPAHVSIVSEVEGQSSPGPSFRDFDSIKEALVSPATSRMVRIICHAPENNGIFVRTTDDTALEMTVPSIKGNLSNYAKIAERKRSLRLSTPWNGTWLDIGVEAQLGRVPFRRTIRRESTFIVLRRRSNWDRLSERRALGNS